MTFKAVTPLNEFITLQRGFDLPSTKRIAGHVPVIASSGIGGYHNENKVKGPGVVIGRSGSIGGGQYIEDDFWPLNTTLWVKDFKGHNPKFVYYLLKSIDFSGFNTGSGVPTLNRNHLGSILVPDLSLSQEKEIADTLSALDDKISSNTLMNKTLERIAQRIFKSWFIDFDPVKANAEGVPFADLSPDIQSLFPSGFVESEMGLIPKGWEVKSFGDLLSLTIGGDWGKEVPDDKHTELCRIVRGTDLNNLITGNVSAVPARYVQPNKFCKRELVAGDIVIEVSGGSPTQPTGRNIRLNNEHIELLGGKVAPASFCRLFRPKSEKSSYFLSSHLTYLYAIGGTWEYQNQSTGIANFQTKFFLTDKKIANPSEDLLSEFVTIVKPLFDKMALNAHQIYCLTKIRDKLLPKLISGSIEINQENNVA